MTRKRTPFGRRLKRREVLELIASGAKPRWDLSAAFDEALRRGAGQQPLVYKLDHERYLFVRDPPLPGEGAGRIVTADLIRRSARVMARVDKDPGLWRASLVHHWAYHSVLKEQLVLSVDRLVDQLRSIMARTPDVLDLSYRSLDMVSQYVEGIGVERALQELYDQLVAYVGEVQRLRIDGRWLVDSKDGQPYPFVLSEKCYKAVMPIHVVWEQLLGLYPVNLRAAAAREVRGSRNPRVMVAADSIPATPPKGTLGTVPADAYVVSERYEDGRPWGIAFTRDVTMGGVVCRGVAWFTHRGEPFAVTLSQEQSLGSRRFTAGSFVQYNKRQGDGRLWFVKLGEDQEVDGLPCRRGTDVEFYANQRLSALVLASDREIDGLPCAAGPAAVSFHKNGRVALATLAREHVLVGRTFPPGTRAHFSATGDLRSAEFAQDWEIDAIPVKAGTTLSFDPQVRVTHVTAPGP